MLDPSHQARESQATVSRIELLSTPVGDGRLATAHRILQWHGEEKAFILGHTTNIPSEVA